MGKHLGIELAGGGDGQTRIQATKTMQHIARSLGAIAGADYRTQIPQFVQQAKDAVRDDPQWSRFRRCGIPDSNGDESRAGFLADSVMLSKITFADDSYSRLQQEIEGAESFFCRHPSYRGLAIHYYETFLRKVNEGN